MTTSSGIGHPGTEATVAADVVNDYTGSLSMQAAGITVRRPVIADLGFIVASAVSALLSWALQRRPATPIPEPPPENVSFGNGQAQSADRLPPGAGRAAVWPHPHPATDRKEQAS